jgi:hypothetical protein
MRIRLICASALLTISLPIGAGVARAQGWAQYSNPPFPPGYGAPAVPYSTPASSPFPPGYNPYGPPGYIPGAPGFVPYGPAQQALPPNYPAYPAYPGSANPQGFVSPGMVPGMPVTRTPLKNVSPNVPQPGGVPSAGDAKPGGPVGEKIGPPAAKAAPESVPPIAGPFVGEPFLSAGEPYIGEPFLDTGEPVIKYVGPKNPGVLPPMRNAVPERLECDRYWFSVGYTTAFIKSERFSTPLATTGSPIDAHPGGLGQPSTAILIGDNANFGMIQGVRLGAGLYGGDHQEWSLEWFGRYLFPVHVQYAANSDATGNPIIARPIFDTATGAQRAFVDGFPGAAAGGVSVDLRSQFFDTEANVAYIYRFNNQLRLDTLFGARYMRLAEDLTITDQLRSLRNNNLKFNGAFIRTGDVLTDYDNFNAVNQFYGLQVGSRARWETDRIFISAFGKLGFGVNNQQVDVNGQTALNGSRVTPGGILALPSNIGTHSRTTFGFVPETGFDIGIRLTPHMQLTAGYSFLYWSRVARPGAQINPNVNAANVPTDSSFNKVAGTPMPTFNFTNENFWLQSFNFGVNFTF